MFKAVKESKNNKTRIKHLLQWCGVCVKYENSVICESSYNGCCYTGAEIELGNLYFLEEGETDHAS